MSVKISEIHVGKWSARKEEKKSQETEKDQKNKKKKTAKKITESLSEKLDNLKQFAKEMQEDVKSDVEATRLRDPAARSNAEVLLLYSGVHAMIAYRVAHRLYVNDHYFSARALSQMARFMTGIEIHPGAEIGKGLMIDHGMGVVIGETAVIGDNCTLYQGVTLGGTGKDVGKRHPTLGNNVMVGAGAKVLGPLLIGDNTKIAANAVVLAQIPENCTAVGIPAKIVRKEGRRVSDDMDQVHIPDPVAQELSRLELQMETLREQIDALIEREKENEEKRK